VHRCSAARDATTGCIGTSRQLGEAMARCACIGRAQHLPHCTGGRAGHAARML
jgi:hypothetical protein